MSGLEKYDFRIDFRKGRFKDHEKKILAAGLCPYFVPVSFMETGSTDTAVYDCRGLSSIEQMKRLNVREALDVLERVLVTVENAAEYLIMPERITLNLQTVFYSADSGRVMIAFVPLRPYFEGEACASTSENGSSLRTSVLRFIDDLKSTVFERDRGYFNSLCKNLENENCGFMMMADRVCEIKRELGACGVC